MNHHLRRLAAPLAASVLMLSACGSDDSDAVSTTTTTPAAPATSGAPATTAGTATTLGGAEAPATTAGESITDEERCARNEAAGKIVYLTNFQFAATPGITDIVAAEDLGYFDELCLDVEIRAGDGTNPSLVAAGTATMARVGSPNDLVVAQSNGIDAVAIATYTNAPQIVLITMTDKVADLADLEGTTLGYKGSMPPEISAMLVEAGVDVSAVETVSVGFDPTILPRGQVDALTGFKSNEVVRLTAAGEDITVFDPQEYGVMASSGSIIANRQFVDEHRGAAQDFLWAAFRALEHCEANPDECLAFSEARSTAGFDLEGERARWDVEIEQLRLTQLADGLGVQTVEQWELGASLLVDAGVVAEIPDLAAFVDTDLAASVSVDGALLSAAP